jgi:dTDP-glucose 4,6-dehydratase
VDGLYRLMESDEHYPVNLGNPLEMTIREFAETIRDAVGAKSTIVYQPLPEDDPKQRQPDITKARRLLGWEPKVDLMTGLRLTIDYFARGEAALRSIGV